MVYFEKYWILIDYMPFTNAFFFIYFQNYDCQKSEKKRERFVSVT